VSEVPRTEQGAHSAVILLHSIAACELGRYFIFQLEINNFLRWLITTLVGDINKIDVGRQFSGET
jgi:hypothetical protein